MNVFIHAIAVPAIYFVSVGLLWSIPTGLLTFLMSPGRMSLPCRCCITTLRYRSDWCGDDLVNHGGFSWDRAT